MKSRRSYCTTPGIGVGIKVGVGGGSGGGGGVSRMLMFFYNKVVYLMARCCQASYPVPVTGLFQFLFPQGLHQ